MKSRLLIIFSIFLGACQNGAEIIRPELKPLIEAVYASGYVISKDEYQVYAQAEGYVLEKIVSDGSIVKPGESLYILESGQQSSRYTLAKKNYDLALKNYNEDSPILKEAITAIEAARTKVTYDSVNLLRFNNLLKNNATTQFEYDRAKVQYDNSKNEYLLQKSRYEKIKNQLFLELENAKSQLAIAGNESGKYIIRSDATGRVFKTFKEKGELIRRGETIAVIGNENTFYLSLSVDELDIQLVKEGQEVVATIDAFNDKKFNGRVSKVYPYVNRQQQSIRVDVSLNDTLPKFYSGLGVEANIVIRKKDKALVIPKSAIVENNFLWIKENGENKKVKVETGIETLEEVEIVNGISPGTEILLSHEK